MPLQEMAAIGFGENPEVQGILALLHMVEIRGGKFFESDIYNDELIEERVGNILRPVGGGRTIAAGKKVHMEKYKILMETNRKMIFAEEISDIDKTQIVSTFLNGGIYVCGVRPECHRMGLGRVLYSRVEQFFLEKGCKYAIVETQSEKADYEPYEKTRRFYESIGFEPQITLTEVWDESNPCLIMVKSLALQALATGMNHRFPEGNNPYQIATRLLEECGEVAKEVNRQEGSGTKVQRHGLGSKRDLAGEIRDALNALSQLCLYYGAHPELDRAIGESLEALRGEGYIG